MRRAVSGNSNTIEMSQIPFDNISSGDVRTASDTSNSSTHKFYNEYEGGAGTLGARRLPIRTIAAAIILLSVGTILLLTGLGLFLSGAQEYVAVLVLGAITFIPGSYASFNLFGAWRGWRGYDWDSVPSYDD